MMFQHASGGFSRLFILGGLAGLLSLSAPLGAQTRKIVLPEFRAVKGLAVLSGPEGPSLTQISALLPPAQRLAPLAPDVQGAIRLAPLPTSAAPRLQGKEGIMNAGLVPLPYNLAQAVQEQLKRVGCYNGRIDGDWGKGSRRAVERYFKAKALKIDEREPTEAIWRGLLVEPEGLCKPEPIAAPAPASGGTKSGDKTKPAPPKPKPVEPKAPTCKFIGIAVICS